MRLAINARVPSLRSMPTQDFAAELDRLLSGRLMKAPLTAAPSPFNYSVATSSADDDERTWYEVQTEFLPVDSGAEIAARIYQALRDFDTHTRLFNRIMILHPDHDFNAVDTATKVNECAFVLAHLGRHHSEYDLSSDYVHHALLEACEIDPYLEQDMAALLDALEDTISEVAPSIGRHGNYWAIKDLDLGSDKGRAALTTFIAMAGECACGPQLNHLDALSRLVSGTSAALQPLLSAVETSTCLVRFGGDEPMLETKYMLDGIAIAEAANDGIDITAGPASVEADQQFSISRLPARSLRPLLGTIALRHAELHLIGLPFEHPCVRWQGAIYEIAALIIDTCGHLPKWSRFIPARDNKHER